MTRRAVNNNPAPCGVIFLFFAATTTVPSRFWVESIGEDELRRRWRGSSVRAASGQRRGRPSRSDERPHRECCPSPRSLQMMGGGMMASGAAPPGAGGGMNPATMGRYPGQMPGGPPSMNPMGMPMQHMDPSQLSSFLLLLLHFFLFQNTARAARVSGNRGPFGCTRDAPVRASSSASFIENATSLAAAGNRPALSKTPRCRRVRGTSRDKLETLVGGLSPPLPGSVAVSHNHVPVRLPTLSSCHRRPEMNSHRDRRESPCAVLVLSSVFTRLPTSDK